MKTVDLSDMEQNTSYEKELAFQADRRKATTELIKITSDLWFDKSIEIVLFKNQVIDRNVSDIIRLHEYAGELVQKPISIFDSIEILRAINDLQLPPSKLDIGKLTYEYHSDDNNFNDVKAFVIDKLKSAIAAESTSPKDVVLYGFSRIGRLLAHELTVKTGKGNHLRLRAIVINGKIHAETLEKSARLLRTDSTYGKFMGTVVVDYEKDALIINGTAVRFISADSLKNIDYTNFDISEALIIDNSVSFSSKAALTKHLSTKGVAKALLTAPGSKIPNVVHGVNHLEYSPEVTEIYAAASCTTNAIAPILKVVNDSLGIVKGHLETIQPYTNDENLTDRVPRKYQNEKSAGLNMSIEQTDIGNAIAKVLPSLKGKLTSNSIRVQGPKASLAILNIEIQNKTSVNGLNTILKKYVLEGDLVEQIKYALNKEIEASDIMGAAAPSIYDSKATIVSNNGKNIVLYIWYDNECGYVHQVIRLAKYIAKVRRYTYD